MTTWMIYGANGYTGRLIAEEARRRGLAPVLAGRSPAVAELAAKLGLPHRIFSLDDPQGVARHLDGIQAVLHCAGPFSRTFRPMLEACLEAGAHYLDITGEMAVFEGVYQRHTEIAARGITAVPGVGFDVVPTDCLAALLHQRLPDATHLRLALSGVEGVSPGTAKTIVEGLSEGGKIRKDDRLVTVPLAYRTMRVPMYASPTLVMSVPLADLVSAARSTGIPNIETFLKTDPLTVAGTHVVQWLGPLIAMGRGPLQEAIGKFVHGPDEKTRQRSRTVVWGEVENAAGRKVAARLHTPEAYSLTVDAAIAATLRLLDGKAPVGAAAPAEAFGADFVLGLPGVSLEVLEGAAGYETSGNRPDTEETRAR